MDVRAVHERVLGSGLLATDGMGGGQILVMVSGGRDSVCLLDVAVVVGGPESVKAMHVNYGLRGEASDGDEVLCVELCRRLGVDLELVHVGAKERAEIAVGGNLQAWAREVRYAAALRRAEELGGTPVATGHTASDQVETILYRLAASPGRRALLGMAPREGPIVRPLLWLTREQTASYCRERNLTWREDESNEDERFARARVRHKLLPALREVHPAAETSVLRTAELLREESDLLDGLVQVELQDAAEIALARLAELHPALARLVLVRLAEQAAGGHVPQAGARLGEIMALGERGGRAELHVGKNISAVIRDGILSMRRLPPRAGVPS
jgi:tRNA(Ile)-lysidine synthase